jgi:hypothetical protein
MFDSHLDDAAMRFGAGMKPITTKQDFLGLWLRFCEQYAGAWVMRFLFVCRVVDEAEGDRLLMRRTMA